MTLHTSPEQPEPEAEPIETSSLHEVNAWKMRQQKQKNLKRCQNLMIEAVRIEGEYRSQRFFYPKCIKHSFEFKRPLVSNEQEEVEYLISSLHDDPIVCPANCTVYQPIWKATVAKPFNWLWKQRKLITAFGNWFIKLPALVQILIVIGIILAIAPQWKDPLIQIIKAIQGK